MPATQTSTPARTPEQRLDATFAALANATRRSILTQLSTGPASVNELAEPFDMSLPAISKHLKVLEHAGLIVRGQRAQFRPCALDPAGLSEAATWVEQRREVWEASFDRMDDYLVTLGIEAASNDPHRQNRTSGS